MITPQDEFSVASWQPHWWAARASQAGGQINEMVCEQEWGKLFVSLLGIGQQRRCS